MAIVKAYREESVESLIRRFRKKVDKEGILFDIRKYDFYKSPSLKKKEKHENALKRAQKAARKREKPHKKGN